MHELSGSSNLYWLFATSNVLLGCVGLGTTIAGIYVCAQSAADWYSLSFIGLGFYTTLVSGWGCKSQNSMSSLCFYLFCTSLSLAAQLTFTVGIILYKDFPSKLGLLSANIIRYGLLGACAVMAVSMVCGWWYRSSLQTVRFYYENYELIKDPKTIETKPSRDREEMLKKYPKLREFTLKET
jgi:hypothetical protein